MRILVTGTDGYIGTILGAYLLQHGFEMVGLDTGLYRTGWLYSLGSSRLPETIVKDIRNVTVNDLEGFDAFVHLAELSNDPLGQLNPEITFKINHEGSVHLANLCKRAGVKRFVYMSSCSVYGIGDDDWKTEESSLNPQTAYAECKVKVEHDVSRMASDDFSPTFLRNATAFGASPRMRFDVVLNNLCGLAWTTNEIKMLSDGTPWRPLVHVLDMSQAIKCCLSADRTNVHNQIINVGDSEQNYRVREIASIVAETFPGCTLSIGSNDGDNRSYRVAFDKIQTIFPEFKCQFDAKAGAAQLRTIFETISMSQGVFESEPYTRLKQLKHLIATQQLTPDLFWRQSA